MLADDLRYRCGLALRAGPRRDAPGEHHFTVDLGASVLVKPSIVVLLTLDADT
ncbi:hypothetical protein ACFWF7_36215 [Nocardia sp. NPDC060256]|uniref:hypothetical protein n=1 Tax=unclassified Nocardia TaxID=2637762 RepID=UPI00364D0223